MENRFGKFLSTQRNGESLRSFADKIGISHAYLKTLEDGVDPRSGKTVTPSFNALKSISNGLNIGMGELLDLAGFVDGESSFDYDTETLTTEYYPTKNSPTVSDEGVTENIKQFDCILKAAGLNFETMSADEKIRAVNILKLAFDK